MKKLKIKEIQDELEFTFSDSVQFSQVLLSHYSHCFTLLFQLTHVNHGKEIKKDTIKNQKSKKKKKKGKAPYG